MFGRFDLIFFKPSLTVVQPCGPQVGLDALLDSLDDVGTVSTAVGEHAHWGLRAQGPESLSFLLT